LPKFLNKILSRFLGSICICCFIGEDSQQITCILKCAINLPLVHWLDFGYKVVDDPSPRITPCISKMAMDPTPHIKTPNSLLDPKVHIRRMTTETFFRFNNLHEGCKGQSQPNSQSNMGNLTNDVDFSIDHEGHQKDLMEEIILKASTPRHEGVSTIMLSAMLLLLNLNVLRGVSNAYGAFITSQHMVFLQVVLPKVLWDAHLVA